MRDNQNLMTEFVKIVQRYPEIYNNNLDTYRTRFSEIAWAKVASHVRNELNEECTIEELKVKWKGIRSSFNRYKAKLNPNNNDSGNCKKYYLYDHLRFLEPFIRMKGSPSQHDGRDQEKSESSLTETGNYVNVEEFDETNGYVSEEWNQMEIKPDVSNTQNDTEILETTRSICTEPTYSERAKKRKPSSEVKDAEDDNEDLTFFKSILPDIRNFTIREKRKLKMGILQLIDEIENDRKRDEGTQ